MTPSAPAAAADINATASAQATSSSTDLGDTGQFAQLLAGEANSAAAACAIEGTEQNSEDEETEDAAADYSPESWLELLAVALGTSSSSINATRSAARISCETIACDARVAATHSGASLVFAGEEVRAAEPNALAQRIDRPKTLAPPLVPAPAMPAQVFGETALRSLTNERTDTPTDRLQDLAASLPTSRSQSQPSVHALAHPVGTPAWQTELATRVVYLVRGAEQSATLNLNPVDLGPVEVRIQIKEGDASVVFTAAQPEARAALESALPRLRELFAAQGLALSESTVLADQGGTANHSQPHPERSHQRHAHATPQQSDELAVTSITVGARSLIDLYA
jgi:flagellar hook-length control protein FliK